MKNKIRILHIDDNLHDRQIVKDALQKEQDEFEIIETDSRLQFELHLNKTDFDLVLSDFSILGLDGLKVIQIVKEKKPETPVIIVTGKGSEEIAVEALKLGAADYVIKSEKHIRNLSPTIKKIIENKKIQDDHKATLIALRKSEERFRLLFNNSMDAVFLNVPEGDILEANTAACNIFGRTEEGLKQVGRNGIIDVTDPRLAIVLKERSRKGICNGELTGLRNDGTPFPIEISSVLFQDIDGNQISSMVIRDITERKRVEKLLQESEKLYRNLFESMLNGFAYCKMLFDHKRPLDFIYLKVNTAFESLTGLHDVVGKKVSEVIPGIQESDPELFKIYGRVALTGKPETFEIYVKTLKLWFLVSIYSPQKEYFVSIFDVITERKLNEKLIQENTSRLELAMQAANMAWWEMDMATGNVVFEKRKVEMLGFSSDKFKHYKDFMALVHPDDYDKAMNAMKGHINGLLDKYEIEYRILTSSGKYKWFYDIGSIVKKDSEGKVLKIAGIVIDISDHKLSEELIVASEIRYRRLFESTQDGILILDAETGMIVDINPYLVELLGYSTEQFHGKKIWEIGIFSDLIANRDKFLELQQKEFVRYDYLPLKTSDGRQIAVEFISNVYEVNKHKVVQCNIRDNTDRANKQNEIKFQSDLINNVGQSVIATDLLGNVTYWNNAAEKIYGWSKSEAIGQNIINLTPAEQSIEQTIDIMKKLSEGKTWAGEFNVKRKNGSSFSAFVTDTPILDSNGKLTGIIGISSDITERKQVREALIESEQLLSKTQKFAHIGSFKYIFNSNEIKWSDEMYTILGLQKDTFIVTQESFINCIHPEDRTSMINWIKHTSNGINLDELDFRIVKPDGTIRNIIGNGILQTDKDSKILQIIGSAQDITERKQAEIEIHNLNTKLELKVEERTKILSEVNINLIEAKAQAERANNSKSEFLSNMSHEIRTPMNAILGYTELLNNILEDKTQKDYLKSIMSSGKTLLTLINDILDLSKIEAGKLELTFDYVNTHLFFSEFERIFSWKVAEKGLEFILEIVSGIPAGIYIDETRLRQILLNIIGNAVKFTHKGHIKLKVYFENPQIGQLSIEKSEEVIDLVIEIEDTGIGISSEFQDHIFEPFSQEQHKNQWGGTGLGLAITRRLLALMNGTIQLQSKLNIGTIFQIKIPNITYLRDFERTTDSFQIDPATVIFEKATILIADDIVHNRKYFVDALKNTNIEIVEAEDGLTAYNLAKNIVPDLIITDLGMPRLDGFGLLKRIHGNAKLSHIPVIAYSASVMKEQKEYIFNCKFSGLLIKPVRVTDLYIELINHLPYKSTLVLEKNHPARKVLFEEINNIQSLIHSLETVYTDVWKNFEGRKPMDEVREFGGNLENLGHTHNAEIIRKYGSELRIAAESFNIESILKLLNKYPGIVKDIKEYQSNN